MKIIVLANADQQTEILLKQTASEAQIIFVENFSALKKHNDIKAYFILTDDIDITELNQFTSTPVFINAVISTIKKSGLSKNFTRIIGWPTFLQRNLWEIATNDEQPVKEIFDVLQWKYLITKDEPGLISARIISMIINEAFFALGDGVSTKEEIDVAMKLGTNYPYGPFEWAEKIGIKNIYKLLNTLFENDKRYNIAPSLQKQITEQE